MKINYNMTRDYCKDWSAIDAIREMVQNALDSNKSYSCTIDTVAGCITVQTKNTALSNAAFALGESVKSGEAIGGYGEGFKIGMLVLARLGLNPQINTGNSIASGEFIYDDFTGKEMFHIVLTECDCNNDITFMCNIGDIDIEELKNKITLFSHTSLPKLRKTVHVLKETEHQGNLYVNGLFVAHDRELTYGYNHAPSKIKLNRDRNMVDGITWQLGDFYASSTIPIQTIFDLLEADAKDVMDFSYHLTNKAVMAELARLFYNKYGDGATMSKPGTSYYSSGVSCGYNTSRAYEKVGIKETKKVTDKAAPVEVLKAFMAKHKSKLRRNVRVDLEQTIVKAKGWKK